MNPLTFVSMLCISSCAWALSACSQNTPSSQPTLQQSSQSTHHDMSQNHITITVGALKFTATLDKNPSAAAFKAMLPMTIEMNELNGKEKYNDLSSNLPVNASRFDTIESGDLMLYGNNTLVLFYSNFSNSYPYTRLEQVNNSLGLAQALGKGDVMVKFDLEPVQKNLKKKGNKGGHNETQAGIELPLAVSPKFMAFI